MPKIIKVNCIEGGTFEFLDEVAASGSLKDVSFSPDRSYVAAIYKTPQQSTAKDRLAKIVGQYRASVFDRARGDYWKKLFCWPERTFEYNGRLGLVVPTYGREFFFQYGSLNGDTLKIRGREKQGKWFATAQNQNRHLDPRERGNWLNYLRLCIQSARAVSRLHRMGLAHSDLSYKNVLIDPVTGSACIIDIDGLVVPNKFPPDVLGTADFIAPEVVQSSHLKREDPSRKVPCIATDRHALAVMVYMYLLYRHPLKGDKVHAVEPAIDNRLMMGERALFIEHRKDRSNRIDLGKRSPAERRWGMPWLETSTIPYTVTGPYLARLFERAFVDGLHQPGMRPTTGEWEEALVKTVDLLLPCQNPLCAQKWFVLNSAQNTKCAFCGAPYNAAIPILNLYSKDHRGNYTPEEHRLVVFHNQQLFLWHCDRAVIPNEGLSSQQTKRVGYFQEVAGRWWFVNEGLSDLLDVSTDGSPLRVRVGDRVEIKSNQKLLPLGQRGRLAFIQVVNTT